VEENNISFLAENSLTPNFKPKSAPHSKKPLGMGEKKRASMAISHCLLSEFLLA